MRMLTAGVAFFAIFHAIDAGAYDFSSLVDGQHVVFDPTADVLNFDDPGATASAVRLTRSGADLGFTYGGKTVWLDGVAMEELSIGPAANVTFANGSVLGIGDGTADPAADAYAQDWDLRATAVGQQIRGLGGADLVQTGSGADWLAGNSSLSPLNHVSRLGPDGGDRASSRATISADGGLVAFDGESTNLVPLMDADINVKDLGTGEIVNEAVSAAGNPGNSGQGSPVISADGRWVVFQGNSSNLISLSAPSGTLYAASLTGPVIEAVSTLADGVTFADRMCSDPDVSADGRYVVFSSWATNLVAGSTATSWDVYLKDRLTGAVSRISTSLTGGDGNGDSTAPKISPDGRFVVFQSAASDLTAGDTNGYTDVFLWDAADGSLTNLTEDAPAANPNNGSFLPDVGSDGGTGAVVVFQTGKGLVAADTCNSTDIYAYRTADGSFTLVSSRADGSCVGVGSQDAAVSGEGRFVVFTGFSDTLVPGDVNGVADVFVGDIASGAIALLSKTAAGTQGDLASGRASISLGGDWIVFESSADNLAATDANGTFPDVFRVSNPFVKDTLVGGAGNDTYEVFHNDIVVEQANGGIDTVLASLSWTLGANLENLTLAGTANNSGTGNALSNVITGNAGSNRLDGSGGNDTASYAAAAGPVTVSLAVASGQDTGAGSDTLVSIENLVGSSFDDRLTGNDGPNRLDGGPGNDVMTGGNGSDTYVCGSAADIVVETGPATDTDTVVSAVTWTIGARLENLTLSGTVAVNGSGNQSANVLRGNDAANTLNGGGGNDTLVGGAGDDTLVGGAGSDQLAGGTGADRFVFSSMVGADTVTDFTPGSDRIAVSMYSLPIGDRDTVIEGAITRSKPGGFGRAAELVIFTANIPDLTPARAAAAIGSATAPYKSGDKRLFVVDNGASSGVFLFTAGGADALVSAGELQLLGTLRGRPNTTPANFLFVP